MTWTDRLQDLIFLVPILVISLGVHEAAHAFVAYRLGDPTAKSRGRITLNPLKHIDPVGAALMVFLYLSSGWLFGWAKPVPISPYYFKNRQRGMAIVGAAGPLTNFILAIIFIEIYNVARPSTSSWVFTLLWIGFQLNLVLGLFNLIPIPPLDGSRILGAFLPRGAYEKWAAVDRYGFLIVLGVILIFRRPFSQGLEWAIVNFAQLFITG